MKAKAGMVRMNEFHTQIYSLNSNIMYTLIFIDVLKTVIKQTSNYKYQSKQSKP